MSSSGVVATDLVSVNVDCDNGKLTFVVRLDAEGRMEMHIAA